MTKSKSATVIFSMLICAGTILTGYLAARESPKAEKAMKEAGNPEEPVEKAKVLAKAYAPAIGCAVGTIGCVFGLNALNKKQQAALIASCTTAVTAAHKNRDKIQKIFEKVGIIQSPSKEPNHDLTSKESEETLFYDVFSNRYFNSTMLAVRDAEYHLNRNFVLRGYVTINELYDFYGLEPIEDGDKGGWDIFAGEEFYGYQWIDFNHVLTKVDDMDCYFIELPFPPTWLDWEADPTEEPELFEPEVIKCLEK